MLSTTAARSILSRAAVKATSRTTTTTKKYSTATSSFQRLLSNQKQCITPSSRSLLTNFNFSTTFDQQQKPNDILNETLEKARLYEQRSELIRRIKSDLIEADVNKDGRLDSDELKLILKKYSDTFTDTEINELGELFYLGKGGESISHERFLKAVSSAYPGASGVGNNDDDNTGLKHRRDSKEPHPLGLGNCSVEYMGGHSRVYTPDELDIKLTHVPPVTFTDKLAHFAVKVVRVCFDTVSLWKVGEITQNKVFRRVIFLETVAGIPGFVAAMVRHFKSLRTFQESPRLYCLYLVNSYAQYYDDLRDGGMMQMFLDEANNERMHLLTFVRMKNPGYIARACVLVSQCVVGAGFFIAYNISPDLCHRFVGYIEEEACHTYTDIIKCVEEAPAGSEMAEWRTEIAPAIARGYWRLGEKGTVLDMLYAVRADEAEHRDVNHTCSGFKEGQLNPLYNPQEKFDEMLLQYAKTIMKKPSV